jgi:hypothetical protein
VTPGRAGRAGPAELVAVPQVAALLPAAFRPAAAHLAAILTVAAWLGMAVLPAAAAPATGELPPTGFTVGEPVPDIVLPSAADGRPVSIAALRGSRLALHIFASW